MAISSYAKEILNRPDLIARRNLWISRIEDIYNGADTGWTGRYVLGIRGVNGGSKHDMYTEPELWVEECLESLAQRYELLENETYFRPLSVSFGPYIVHYIDKMFGAEVYPQGKLWYSKPLTTPVGTLQMPDLDKDPTWNMTKRAVQAFLEAEVALPFFGLPTIASALNIAVNLYGEEFLIAMLAEPEDARADLAVINNLLCELHRYFIQTLPAEQLQPVCPDHRSQPVGYGQICGCTTQLISGELYKEFIAPLDDQLLSVYPNGGMIHLCGAHTQHLDAFRSMKSLKAIQINGRANADLQEYFDKLREDQIIYLYISDDNITLERAMEITGGRRLILASKVPEEPVLRR